MPELALNTTIVTVLIIFPGIILRRFFFLGPFSKQFFRGEWSERLVTSIFWGLISQLVSLYLFSLTPWAINNDTNNVIKSISNFELPDKILTNSNSILFLLAYIIFCLIISASLGFISHKIIRVSELDIRYKILRFSNDWHYYFKGEILKTDSFSKYKNLKVLFSWIDVVIDTRNGKNKMIQGVLSQYSINRKTGDVEYLYIDEAERWSNSEQCFKPISSHIFVVPFRNVIDFNIRYNYTIKNNRIKRRIIRIIFLLFVVGSLVLPWYFAKVNSGVLSIVGAMFFSLLLLFMIWGYFTPRKPKTVVEDGNLVEVLPTKRNFKEHFYFWSFVLLFFVLLLLLLGYNFEDIYSSIRYFI